MKLDISREVRASRRDSESSTNNHVKITEGAERSIWSCLPQDQSYEKLDGSGAASTRTAEDVKRCWKKRHASDSDDTERRIGEIQE